MNNPQTLIIGEKNETNAALLRIEYTDDISTEAMQKFATEAVDIALTKGIGGALSDYEESQHAVIGAGYEILDMAVSSGDVFDVRVNTEGTKGAIVSVNHKDSAISDMTMLATIASTIAVVATDNMLTIEYITEDDMFGAEAEQEDEKKKVLLNQTYPDGSGETIGQVLLKNNLSISVSLSRLGKSSVAN